MPETQISHLSADDGSSGGGGGGTWKSLCHSENGFEYVCWNEELIRHTKGWVFYYKPFVKVNEPHRTTDCTMHTTGPNEWDTNKQQGERRIKMINVCVARVCVYNNRLTMTTSKTERSREPNDKANILLYTRCQNTITPIRRVGTQMQIVHSTEMKATENSFFSLFSSATFFRRFVNFSLTVVFCGIAHKQFA